jgi:pimeloyl-ACP methyl ester carboxylesterase
LGARSDPAAGPAPTSQAALDHLTARDDVAADKVVLFGRSLGGAVAIHLAAANQGKVRAWVGVGVGGARWGGGGGCRPRPAGGPGLPGCPLRFSPPEPRP